jgi:hypothetical protein
MRARGRKTVCTGTDSQYRRLVLQAGEDTAVEREDRHHDGDAVYHLIDYLMMYDVSHVHVTHLFSTSIQ